MCRKNDIPLGYKGSPFHRIIKDFMSAQHCTTPLHRHHQPTSTSSSPYQALTYSLNRLNSVLLCGDSVRLQGGDFIHGDGTGVTSIYQSLPFKDESFTLTHTRAGLLSMANSGVDSNGCQFFITCGACEWLDGKHVVFGQVIDGMLTVRKMEQVPTGQNNRPKLSVTVAQCGEL